jgi:hypothetical protein
MSELILTPDNYISVEADRAFMSFHQYKAWLECEAAEHAKLFQGWDKDSDNAAFLLGNYVDNSLLTPEKLQAFCDKNKVFKKDGTKRAEFIQGDRMVARIQKDPTAMKLIAGDHQWICAGEIDGVPWRIMVDCIKPKDEIFVDLKTCRSCTERMWDKILSMKLIWYEYYGYWGQMSVYCEIIKQRYNKEFLPVVLAVSKEEPADILAVAFSDKYRISQELANIRANLPRIMAVKTGKAEPKRCENCAYCRETKILSIIKAENQGCHQPLSDMDVFGMGNGSDN